MAGKKQQNKTQEKIKNKKLNLTLSLNTLNVTGLNIPIKRARASN